MAKVKQLEPTILTVFHDGKSAVFRLSDKFDWGIVFENTVLEIKSLEPLGTFYWPLDYGMRWKTEPQTALSGHA